MLLCVGVTIAGLKSQVRGHVIVCRSDNSRLEVPGQRSCYCVLE